MERPRGSPPWAAGVCQTVLDCRSSETPGTPRSAVYTFTRLAPAIPSEVYSTYWRFAAERQEIFFRRLRGDAWPWTKDAILQRYKFTNAYRASDRTSQFLINDVIYRGDQSTDEVFFRIMLFKLFNRIATWKLLERGLGEISWSSYRFELYDSILTRIITDGGHIYSAAYIMPAGQFFGQARKHRNHLKLLERIMVDEVPERLVEVSRLRQVFELLRSYPGIGDFLAYQFSIDLNYGQLMNHSEMEFVVPGPGAREGIQKCFSSLGGLSEADAIRLMVDRQHDEFNRLGLEFRSLWGRSLQLIDCQNLFCEVGKYARLAHPHVRARSGRKRIKQVYRPNPECMTYWYPPKWGINDLISGKVPPEN